jgi:hypothetical protein
VLFSSANSEFNIRFNLLHSEHSTICQWGLTSNKLWQFQQTTVFSCFDLSVFISPFKLRLNSVGSPLGKFWGCLFMSDSVKEYVILLVIIFFAEVLLLMLMLFSSGLLLMLLGFSVFWRERFALLFGIMLFVLLLLVLFKKL